MVPATSLAPVLSLRGQRRLVIGAEIGRGSRSSVHIARIEQAIDVTSAGEEVMARTVALKVVDPALCRDPETMHELKRSVRRSALVRHANVVGVHDFFVATLGESIASEPVPCVVEELVDGMSLARFVARFEGAGRRIPLDLVLFIGCEIAEALSGARGATSIDGVILNMAHHDLSARQVLLSWNGEVKVGDFGWRPGGGVVSGVRRTDQGVREQLLHMAPEVARGSRGDGRADVFSLGVILHEMLYGPRFRHACSPREALELVRDGVVERPVVAPLLPPTIGAIVDRALSPDPRERQAHAGIVAYDLRREALALGVADGRMFLRSAMFEMAEGLDSSA
ncbi:MAG TPA: protein kinase [Polyangiaceae bacterium]|jgi:serine/threonine-protein kinase